MRRSLSVGSHLASLQISWEDPSSKKRSRSETSTEEEEDEYEGKSIAQSCVSNEVVSSAEFQIPVTPSMHPSIRDVSDEGVASLRNSLPVDYKRSQSSTAMFGPSKMKKSHSVGSHLAELAISWEDPAPKIKRSRSDKTLPKFEEEQDETDNNDIEVEVTTGEGVTTKLQVSATATVLTVKQGIEREHGILPTEARIFCQDEMREDELRNDEMVRNFRIMYGAKVEMLMLVEKSDALQVVPEMRKAADLVLGEEMAGNGQLIDPAGVAFVPSHPDWLVTTKFPDWLETNEAVGHCVTISNIRTGALVCKFGEEGDGEGQFNGPEGVAVTSDSSFVLIADYSNNRIQVLKLVVDGSSAHLEFVRFLGSGEGGGEGNLGSPVSVALLPSGDGQDTVLVAEVGKDCVSQFALGGKLLGTFVGSVRGSGNGELHGPWGITVLALTGEVAVADRNNHRIQIFDDRGNYLRQFGGKGDAEDGKFHHPSGLASDAYGNIIVLDITARLQVFSPKGKHLCTRSDLGLSGGSTKDVAWNTAGGLAVANTNAHEALIWSTGPTLGEGAENSPTWDVGLPL
jgi:DNA-binding beta-propeller fold protein YncE